MEVLNVKNVIDKDFLDRLIAVTDDKNINFDDIPEITDLSGLKIRRGQDFSRFFRDGKCEIIIEHNGYNEIVEYDTKTGQKKVLQLIVMSKEIVIEDRRYIHESAPS